MRFVAVVLLFGLCAACAGEAQVTGDRRDVGVVTVVFTATPARGQVGQPVRLRIRLSNNGGKTEHLVTPSGQLYDFWVRDRGRTVWRWSGGQAFVQQVTTTDLTTQSTTAYSEIWRPTESGRFTVYGEMKAAGYTGPMKGTVIVR